MPFSFRYPSQRRYWLSTETATVSAPTPEPAPVPTPPPTPPSTPTEARQGSLSREVLRHTGTFHLGDFFSQVATHYNLFGMGQKAATAPAAEAKPVDSVVANRRPR
ncbi:MAG: hypothetical protein P4M14_07065 [Gammaproteobacteria bacterium]|nr:hypothetical protein [Gammaproteobacteria bacterium]